VLLVRVRTTLSLSAGDIFNLSVDDGNTESGSESKIRRPRFANASYAASDDPAPSSHEVAGTEAHGAAGMSTRDILMSITSRG